MADSKVERGTGLWKLVPKLTRANKNEWFDLVEQVLEGEDAAWLLKKTNKEYAHVKDSLRKQEPESDWTFYNKGEGTQSVKWWIMTGKDLQYKRAQVQFRLNLRLKISSTDKDMIDEFTGVPAQFAALKDAYNQITHTTGASQIVAFTTWSMNVEISPSNNYSQLIKLRKNVHQFSPGTRFSTEFMWNLFVAGLRPRQEYMSLAEGFPSDMELISRLLRLDEKWEMLQAESQGKKHAFQAININTEQIKHEAEQAVEAALAARRMRGQSFPGDQNCFKCGSSRHVSIICPFAEIGFDAAKRARIRRNGEESDEEVKVYQPPRSYASRIKTQQNNRNKSPDFREKAYSSSNWKNQTPANRPRNVSKFDRLNEHAKLAEEPSDEESDTQSNEFGGLSWEQRIHQ